MGGNKSTSCSYTRSRVDECKCINWRDFDSTPHRSQLSMLGIRGEETRRTRSPSPSDHSLPKRKRVSEANQAGDDLESTQQMLDNIPRIQSEDYLSDHSALMKQVFQLYRVRGRLGLCACVWLKLSFRLSTSPPFRVPRVVYWRRYC